jgi:RimJ/RimL family protein N-acetyltransferase
VADPRLQPVTLTGTHVRLEPLDLRHAEALALAATGDRSSYAFTNVPASIDEAVTYIDAAVERDDQLPFATIRLADETVIGSTRFLEISFWHDDDPDPSSCEIGATWLAHDAQRTAINTEAKLLQLSHAFEVWGCLRVQLKTDARNERSRNAIVRIGASFEGVLRNFQAALPGPGPRDTAIYSITDDEWPGVKFALQDRLSAAQAEADSFTSRSRLIKPSDIHGVPGAGSTAGS